IRSRSVLTGGSTDAAPWATVVEGGQISLLLVVAEAVIACGEVDAVALFDVSPMAVAGAPPWRAEIHSFSAWFSSKWTSLRVMVQSVGPQKRIAATFTPASCSV